MAEFDIEALKKDVRRRMVGAVDVLQREFGGLRTGRASVSLLEPLTVKAYGSLMPMNQVGTIGVPDARMLSVQVWDKSLVGAVERSIRESDLGLNPATEGQLVRIPIPTLTEERRGELGKVAGRYTEEARVAIRNVRRHAVDDIKHAERDGHISQDQQHEYAELIQDLTDEHIARIDEALANKEQEIMEV